MQCIFLIMGIVYATRIPGFIRAVPGPNQDPQLFRTWRAKELWSIYVFLAATWGSTVLALLLGVVLGVGMALTGSMTNPSETAVAIYYVVYIGLFVGLVIWSAVLGTQASRLKKQLAAYVLPASYYPRDGAPLLQAPPSQQSPQEPASQPDAAPDQYPGS